MAFIKFKHTTVIAHDIYNAGEILDASGDAKHWEYWVGQGVADFLPESESQHFPNNKHSAPRPIRELTTLCESPKRLDLPPGSFNPGLIAIKGGYALVYRPDEYSFAGVKLNKNLEPTGELFPFNMTNCADPRLIQMGNQVWMIYSSFSDPSEVHRECIRGKVCMQDGEFVDGVSWRVSPEDLTTRQKNWCPFIYENELHFISDWSPLVVWKWAGDHAEKIGETEWLHPWMFQTQLRGNTNLVQLDNGNFLGTFHTATLSNKVHHYDNGGIILEGKPPFKPIKAANKTYLRAEDAKEPYFRRHNIIQCPFPVGMVKEKNKLLISYGSNDSACYIMTTTVKEMEQLMVVLY